ncbi:hypothetical protein [Prevotella pectinovora]|uniref:hypothetical protein n=1 Tax=Prevotella pectinovora TaxID=1602169 RepID=UPI0035220FAD
MKKKYISPKIDVMYVEALCSSFRVASVYKGSLKGECIGSFQVVDETVTKTDGTYKTLWGESNSDKWGDD